MAAGKYAELVSGDQINKCNLINDRHCDGALVDIQF